MHPLELLNASSFHPFGCDGVSDFVGLVTCNECCPLMRLESVALNLAHHGSAGPYLLCYLCCACAALCNRAHDNALNLIVVLLWDWLDKGYVSTDVGKDYVLNRLGEVWGVDCDAS